MIAGAPPRAAKVNVTCPASMCWDTRPRSIEVSDVCTIIAIIIFTIFFDEFSWHRPAKRKPSLLEVGSLLIDHLTVAALTLEQGVAHVQHALGVVIPPGGAHPLMGTHNHVMQL